MRPRIPGLGLLLLLLLALALPAQDGAITDAATLRDTARDLAALETVGDNGVIRLRGGDEKSPRLVAVVPVTGGTRLRLEIGEDDAVLVDPDLLALPAEDDLGARVARLMAS